MTLELQKIIKRLKECVENSNLTYVELEKRTGIAKSSIQRYVSGTTKKIPVDSIQVIANALGVAPEYILGWDNYTKTNEISLYNKPSTVIRNKRTELGLTVEELAKTIGVNESKIKNWENGFINAFKPSEITKLAEVLEINPVLLLEDESNLSSKVADSSNEFKIHTDEEKLLLNNYNALNQTGKEKLMDYSDDLVSNGKYTEKR